MAQSLSELKFSAGQNVWYPNPARVGEYTNDRDTWVKDHSRKWVFHPEHVGCVLCGEYIQ